MSPLEIARKMGKKTDEIKRFLLLQVGEHELRLSNILYSIPPDRRQAYKDIVQRFSTKSAMHRSAIARRLDPGELDLFRISCDAPRGDLYVSVADLETFLHSKIRTILVTEYGPDELGWWRKGVPTEIRKQCISKREEDVVPMDNPYNYTTFIDLFDIMDQNWSLFTQVLPQVLAANKRHLKEDFRKLNYLRNCIMHPVRGAVLGKEELDFVTCLRNKFMQEKWRDHVQ
ncbi:MAG: hypothetical protein M0R70_03565 [Nitrospirae bacterium]|nr:hypothetical protein [Nitrospirota bacterium]